MTPARMDRLLVAFTAAVLTAWSACLVHLWAYATDSSGESTLMTAAALLLGVRPALSLPSRVVRAARRLFRGGAGKVAQTPATPSAGVKPPVPRKGASKKGPKARPQRLASLLHTRDPDVHRGAAHGQGTDSASPPDPRALKALLGAAVVFAGFSGLGAMPMVLAAKLLGDWLSATFLWTRASWLAAEMGLRLVCLLPMAMALAVTMLVGAMVRRGSGRDVYASVFREWLAGAAAGLASVAAAWWAGVNLLAMAMAMPVLLFAAAAAIFYRKGVRTPPPSRAARVPAGPAEKTGARPPRTFAIWATFAALAAGLTVQSRLASDVLGLSFAPCAAWAAFSLFLIVAFLRVEDHKAAPPARGREVGGLVGLTAVVVMQCSMSVLALGGGPADGFCTAMAMAAQVPACALAAGVLSRQRRAHAVGGGRARSYLGGVCGGSGVGILGCLLAGWSPATGMAGMVWVAVGVLAWGGCREVFLSRTRGEQARWAVAAATLLLATASGLLLAIHEAGTAVGSIEPGAWLSSLDPHQPKRTDGSSAKAGGEGPRAVGVLPVPLPHRSPAVAAALEEVLARPSSRGAWWLVASSPADLPAELPWGVSAAFSAPDPSAAARVYGARPRSWLAAPFFQAARAGRERYDGLILAPLPANHPDAWRCYNDLAMQRAADRLHAGGAFLLRTQARQGSGEARLLAVAATFRQAVEAGWRTSRPGWAAVAFQEGWVDVLLGGPAEAAAPPEGREGLFVWPLEELLAGPFDVPPVRLVSPGSFLRSRLPEGASVRERMTAPPPR